MNRAIATLCITAVAASLLPLPGRAQTTPPLVTIRLAATPNDDVTPVLYAQHAGLFQRAGLNVILDKVSTAAAVAAALAGGSYDIGKMGTAGAIDAHAKGLPFVMVAAAAMYQSASPYGGLIALNETDLRSGKDLEGKTIGVASLGSMGWLAINAWTTKNGGDRKALRLVELPFPTVFDAVTAHRVYGAELAYPQLAPALESKTVKLVPIYSAIAPAYLFSAWMTTKDWAAKNATAVRAFAHVMSAASAYANAHHAETVPLLAAFSGMSEAQIQGTVRVAYGVTLNPADLQPVIAATALGELIKAPFPAQDMMFEPAAR